MRISNGNRAGSFDGNATQGRQTRHLPSEAMPVDEFIGLRFASCSLQRLGWLPCYNMLVINVSDSIGLGMLPRGSEDDVTFLIRQVL